MLVLKELQEYEHNGEVDNALLFIWEVWSYHCSSPLLVVCILCALKDHGFK
jgi:hypothetical protein